MVNGKQTPPEGAGFSGEIRILGVFSTEYSRTQASALTTDNCPLATDLPLSLSPSLVSRLSCLVSFGLRLRREIHKQIRHFLQRQLIK